MAKCWDYARVRREVCIKGERRITKPADGKTMMEDWRVRNMDLFIFYQGKFKQC